MKKFTISLLFLLSLSSVFALSVKKCDAIEQEVDHVYFTVGYDEDTECPLYVIYTLDEDEIANLRKVPRKEVENFKSDESIRTGSAHEKDYKDSGYDKGHLFPFLHASFNEDAGRLSFLMSNMCPQGHYTNRQAWMNYEKNIAALAADYGPVERVCGPVFYKDRTPRYIGKANKVRVPDALYSIISYNKNGEKTIECIIMSNVQDKADLVVDVVKIEDIEKLTGIDFEE